MAITEGKTRAVIKRQKGSAAKPPPPPAPKTKWACAQHGCGNRCRHNGEYRHPAADVEVMADRELLELAAKATGFFDYPDDSIEQGEVWHTDKAKAPFDFCFPKALWNPLTDDGDALRLAVKLGIQHSNETNSNITWAGVLGKTEMHREEYTEDPYAATRRAIVRATAEIGRNME